MLSIFSVSQRILTSYGFGLFCYCQIRMDSRHNFSPHFYWLYLTDMTSSSRLTEDMFLNVPVFLSMMTFLPQVLCLYWITWIIVYSFLLVIVGVVGLGSLVLTRHVIHGTT